MIVQSSKAEFFPYPRNVVIAVLDDLQGSGRAVKALKKAGFPEPDIHLFHGEEAAERIDATGRHLGPIKHVLRSLRWLLSEEGPMLSEYEEEAHAGHHILFVKIHRSQQVQRAAVILATHHAHTIRYFGRWLITDLLNSLSQQGIPASQLVEGTPTDEE
jgi:hypothetical protein